MHAAETVRHVLVAAREEGLDFDRAWHRALRQLVPPEQAHPELVAEHKADKPILRETKAFWRAAYERDDVSDALLAAGMAHARRRLKDLLLNDTDAAVEDDRNGRGPRIGES